MDIGTEEKPFTVEPSELPAPLEIPAAPAEPVYEPAEPEKVPA